MSEWVDIPLATSLGEDASSAYASEAVLVNLMLKENPPGSRKPFHIANTPGLTSSPSPFGTLPGSGRIRGVCVNHDGVVFMIRGTGVHYTSNLSTWSTTGGSMPGTAICRMVDAGTHVVAVDGANARAITTATAAACSKEDFSDVTYQDGYTVFTQTGTDSIYASDADDPTTIGALNFTTVDALPGDCVGLISDHREIFVFKKTSIEHYYNDGSAGFPFARSSPGVIERGCWPFGKWAICKYENAIYWVGDDLRVYAMRGLVPQVISTPWVEKSMRDHIVGASSVIVGSNVSLYGSTFVFEGEPYYAINGLWAGAGTSASLVCNIRTQLWHVRWHTAGSSEELFQWVPYRSSVSTTTSGETVIVAANTASSSLLYGLGSTDASEGGETVVRFMELPQLSFGGRRAFMPELYLDMQKFSAAGTLELQTRDDNDTSDSSAVTATGTNARTRWLRLGSFYQRTLKFIFTVKSSIAIMGVRARIEVGE